MAMIQCCSKYEVVWTFHKDKLVDEGDTESGLPHNFIHLIRANNNVFIEGVTRQLNQGDYVCLGEHNNKRFLSFSTLFVRGK